MFSGKCSRGKDFATIKNFQPNIIVEIMENLIINMILPYYIKGKTFSHKIFTRKKL